MVHIDVLYTGDLHCEVTHGPSGRKLVTDAPKDNMGKGESFSPTDLLAVSLGTCMVTTMAIAARKLLQIDLGESACSVEKVMSAAPPRRIAELKVVLRMQGQYTSEQKEKLEAAAMKCPVHKSLHPDVVIPVEFQWEQA